MKTLLRILILFVFLSGCNTRNVRQVVSEPVKVRTMIVSETTDVRSRSYIGKAEASRSVVITAPYPGTLESLPVKVGDRVRKDEVMAEISSETVRSSYDMAAATLKQAEDGYERASKVYGSGGLSEVRYIEVETSLAKARASEAAARSALDACSLKAPFAGTVSEIYAQQGTEIALAGPVMKIVDGQSVEISIPVPESELSRISVGTPARVDIPALGVTEAGAVVISKGVEASSLSHTYDCRLRLASSVNGFLPGMVCKVYLAGDTVKGNVIPAALVQTDQKGRYLWTVRDGVVYKTYIETGGFSGSGVIVAKGLAAGDEVISEGFRKVSSGMKVNVVE